MAKDTAHITKRAGARVNGSQLAKDTAQKTPHTEQAQQ